MTPRATYRLQFGPDFGFADAAALAPYLSALGVSHVYLAPVFAARPGSTHGYDVTDPAVLSPELGGEAGFRAMVAAFRTEGLGIVLDIVPNHMGIGGAANHYWLDVLANGPESRFARWFDIDWQACGGRVILPVLGEGYGAALTSGALDLRADGDGFAVWAHDTHKLPVRSEDTAAIREAGVGTFRGAALDALIARQHWRPAKFSLERDGLNYRRFFAISDLAGVRVEDEAVFEATQALALRLVDEGVADGLRIDHIDGLRDPKTYLHRLRRGTSRPFWLLVEKILGQGETLPADWDVDGTTGYEVTNLLVGLLADPAGNDAMTEAYAAFAGRTDPVEIVRHAKREMLERLFASEFSALSGRLAALAAASLRFRDVGADSVKVALVEVIVALDVYRTYADANGLSASDRERLTRAVGEARRAAAWLEPDAFNLVEAALGLDLDTFPGAEAEVREAAARAQQLTGPVMAKGLEDTALYRYARLLALNEVGSEPGRFSTDVAAFHAANAARAPGSMLTTSTHDTKRGEDARARIAALPRHAAAWAARVPAWHRCLADPEAPIDPNDAYFFYQLLLGAWPMEWRPGVRRDGWEAFTQRVRAAMLKSVREAAVNTTWVNGDPDYEARLAAFLDRALDPSPGNGFLASFRTFEAEIAADGAANALIQTALRLTLPGVPDTYQGADCWEQSLVDPDNRRPVDFAGRAAMLAALPPGPAAFPNWTDPMSKLALTARVLRLRRDHPELFAAGDYRPLDLPAPLVGFVREAADARLLVAASLRHGPAQRGLLPLPEGRWREVLTEAEIADPAAGHGFDILPVAVFVSSSG
ncbi:(1-_4)-alpha-D-glucan 1-alpha-D-glucosylmutase [Amaricoccus macauensis]|uniref:(1->4)-alpha-D-glucan 1-alpha-D-glucosylmutase n=1 Tax=Amaricoccus macauensis TaxID=57001 RepID=A0A840SUD4_9RHOB|nr:malto-oligosyltrehalose synthase [Amaricoccus macauensis]MBB5224125.1 (1->4)-alpha-D-glucan 1-alpha-D-glucosylmutase [Amaricoccus macauensis]